MDTEPDEIDSAKRKWGARERIERSESLMPHNPPQSDTITTHPPPTSEDIWTYAKPSTSSSSSSSLSHSRPPPTSPPTKQSPKSLISASLLGERKALEKLKVAKKRTRLGKKYPFPFTDSVLKSYGFVNVIAAAAAASIHAVAHCCCPSFTTQTVNLFFFFTHFHTRAHHA